MDNLVQTIAIELKKINQIIKRYINNQNLSFEEKRELWLFYDNYNNTNLLVDFVIRIKNDDINDLLVYAYELKKEADTFVTSYKSENSLFSSFNTKKDCESYLKPLKDVLNAAKEKANNKSRELNEEAEKRLDMMPPSDPEYEELVRKRDILKAEYDKLHKQAYELSDKYREAEIYVAGLYYFEISFLYVLVCRLSEIAHCIISDITNYSKEDDV